MLILISLILFGFQSNIEITKNIYPLKSELKSYYIKLDKKDRYQLITLDSLNKVIESREFLDSICKISIADFDNDGNEDIALGIIKSSRWSNEKSLKMHLYKIKDSRILPLWRSSKLTSNLIDYTFIKDSNITYCYAIEKLKTNSFNLIKFKWKSFGYAFVDYKFKHQDSIIVFNEFHKMKFEYESRNQ